ncbi:MAG: hypothetical protein DWI22_09475 [Planctomycetota bacterium]|jgi:hypothetical protein|nr:hypothetical protein [Planctomycetales bacterium]RLT07673.1 MAG: hypothetical protein DWI22_09475 [Planctomycetota bacterium]
MSELARLWLPILLSGSAVFCANFLIAYLATLALEPGATFSKVFQVTGTSEILAYPLGNVPNTIWFGTHHRAILMDLIDGVFFGLITGLIFAAFWP